MRPEYVTNQDLNNEIAVAKFLESKWGCEARKMPNKFSRFDYALLRSGQLTCMAEIKCRTCPVGYYDDYMISYDKWSYGVHGYEVMHLTHIIVVAWSDAVGWVYCANQNASKCRLGGRTDRGDESDVEVVVDIPIKNFSIL